MKGAPDDNGLPSGLEVQIMHFPSARHIELFVEGYRYRYGILVIAEGLLEFPEYKSDFHGVSLDICLLGKPILIKVPADTPAKLYIVRFTEYFTQDSAYSIHRETIAQLFGADLSKVASTPDMFKVIKRLLLLLYKHYRHLASPHSALVSQLTFNLLLSCITELQLTLPPDALSSAGHKVSLGIRFLHLVENHANREHSVKFYASELCMTRGNLARIIKEVLGKAPKAVIEGSLVKKARLLLDTSSEPVYAIAERLGFSSASAFANFFKSRTGMTPNAYRTRKNT